MCSHLSYMTIGVFVAIFNGGARDSFPFALRPIIFTIMVLGGFEPPELLPPRSLLSMPVGNPPHCCDRTRTQHHTYMHFTLFKGFAQFVPPRIPPLHPLPSE